MAKTKNGTIGFEEKLWQMSDKLRNNMDPSEYKHVVLGLVFIKYISDAFDERYEELKNEGDGFEEERDAYTEVNIFYVPPNARWEYIMKSAKQPEIGEIIDDAMISIERENSSLKGVLPKIYARPDLNKSKLGELIDMFSFKIGDKDSRASDVLGRVYEYFLGKFASAEGKGGGEFYTPQCIVKLLAEMLEPYKGRVYDPCCGSGGMFVQSERFVESHQGKLGDISIYGQESNPTTWRLCRMNLAIRGIDGNIGKQHADSMANDLHKRLKADFIMSNPPFNISDWGGESLADDIRWKYGTPPQGNANFAWIQHFISHLAPRGIAGFVMHGGAASNRGAELEIRKRIIEDDLVECIVSLPTQLFYNVSLPVHLWFINKQKSRKDEILMIDASEYGYMDDVTHRVLSAEDIMDISEMYKKWKRSEGYHDIPGKCISIKKDRALNNNSILAPNRYVEKPKIVSEKSFEEDTNFDFQLIEKSIREVSKFVKRIEEQGFDRDVLQDTLKNKVVGNFTYDNWEQTPIAEVVSEVIGGEWGKAEPKKGYKECKVIRGTDFPNIPLYKLEKIPTRFIKEDKIEDKKLIAGDLVIEMSGGSKNQATGRYVFITEEFLEMFDQPVLCTNFNKIIRVNKSRVLPLWFYWYWKQSYKQGLTAKYENQPSGIKNFQLEEYMENELIFVPDISTQNNIIDEFKAIEAFQNNSRRLGHLYSGILEKVFLRVYYEEQD